MVNMLTYSDASFEAAFTALLQEKHASVENVDRAVEKILAQIRQDGDKAVLELTRQFDQLEQKSVAELRVAREDILSAFDAVPHALKAALEHAAARIESYHKAQLPKDFMYEDEQGVTLGNIWNAVEAVGLYVPGGLAAYPSSVLMNAIPAKVAGVERMVMVVPAPKGELNPLVLTAAHIAGIEEIYTIGGAQAIAALAYGTETIPKVDKIVGPGNIFVATAKRMVFGQVGIDMIAGPSDILVVADKHNDPKWIAVDLLSQAEHDTDASSMLITDDKNFANKVIHEIESFIPTLERKDIARASWETNGGVLLVHDLETEGVELINRIAPEHLELAVENPKALLPTIRNAGAIFLGAHTPEPIGDYIAGPSHVLPTSGTARFASGLSVFDFLKRSSLIGCTEESFLHLLPDAEKLAEAEGFGAHALSMTIRKP